MGQRLGIHFREPQPEGDILADVAELKFGLLRTLVADVSEVRKAGLLDERFRKFDGYWLSVQLAASCRFAYADHVLVRKRDASERRVSLQQAEGQARPIWRACSASCSLCWLAWMRLAPAGSGRPGQRHILRIQTDFKREGAGRLRRRWSGFGGWTGGILTWREVWQRVRR